MNPKWRPYQNGSNGSPTGLDPARRGLPGTVGPGVGRAAHDRSCARCGPGARPRSGREKEPRAKERGAGPRLPA